MSNVLAEKTGVFIGYKMFVGVLITVATFAITMGQLQAEQSRTVKTVQTLEKDVVDLKILNSKMSEILIQLDKQDERLNTDIRAISQKLDKILLESK